MKAFFAFLWFGLCLAGIVGWVMNLIKLFGLWGQEITTEFIIRLAGVPIPPIGAIAGYF